MRHKSAIKFDAYDPDACISMSLNLTIIRHLCALSQLKLDIYGTIVGNGVGTDVCIQTSSDQLVVAKISTG